MEDGFWAVDDLWFAEGAYCLVGINDWFNSMVCSSCRIMFATRLDNIRHDTITQYEKLIKNIIKNTTQHEKYHEHDIDTRIYQNCINKYTNMSKFI